MLIMFSIILLINIFTFWKRILATFSRHEKPKNEIDAVKKETSDETEELKKTDEEEKTPAQIISEAIQKGKKSAWHPLLTELTCQGCYSFYRGPVYMCISVKQASGLV
jgi:cytoskeletal protein RodZ